MDTNRRATEFDAEFAKLHEQALNTEKAAYAAYGSTGSENAECP